MSITYSTSIIDARLQDVIDAIDSGAGSGLLEIGTTGMGMILSTIVLAKPCATISSGIMTFSNVPLTGPYAAATGTAAAGRLTNSASDIVGSGLTVGLTTAYDITITKINISMGDIVTLVSGTIIGR